MSANLFTFSAAADDDMATLMSGHGSLRIDGTPLRDMLLMRLQGSAEDLDDIEGSFPNGIEGRVLRGKDHLIVLMPMPGSVAEILDHIEEGAYLLPPLLWEQGRLTFRILAFGEIRSGTKPATVLESRTVLRGDRLEEELLASGLLLPSLTRRQGESLLAALESGYYDSPRRASGAEVAKGMGIARSTFEEHLRSAEAQLIKAMSPVVRMRLQEKELGLEAVGPEAVQLFASFSKDLGLYVSMSVRGDKVTRVDLTEEPPEDVSGDAHPYLSRVLELIATGRGDLGDIPLDMEVTPFERQVLEALRTVPPGEVVTYGQIARLIGRPQASRAVGHACAVNPAIVLVPCHRVVPAAGGLGNYSGGGGPSTKRWLLEREGALPKVEKRSRKD